jgi:NitT/TauT family transport system substrate-binding protein
MSMSLSRRAAVRAATALLLAAGLAPSSEARAEGRIRIAEQFGIAYLPLHVVRDQKLIEKHGRAQGIDIAVEWTRLGGGASVNDALLSGSVDIGTAGIGPVLTLWDRTRGNANVRAIAALGSLPSFLITRNPNVKTLRDFGPNDKIALPAVGVSVQARTLQIAVEKAFGPGKHTSLDTYTVTLAHPDATAAVLSGASEITSHFSNPPFQYQALKDPNVRKVLSSYDVVGGPATSSITYATERFRSENPKTYAAFFAALKEAVAWIHTNKAAAAETYTRMEKSKLDPVFVRSLVEDPDIQYKLTPERTYVYADFLHRIGAIKAKPESWKDYFFDDIQVEAGS